MKCLRSKKEKNALLYTTSTSSAQTSIGPDHEREVSRDKKKTGPQHDREAIRDKQAKRVPLVFPTGREVLTGRDVFPTGRDVFPTGRDKEKANTEGPEVARLRLVEIEKKEKRKSKF